MKDEEKPSWLRREWPAAKPRLWKDAKIFGLFCVALLVLAALARFIIFTWYGWKVEAELQRFKDLGGTTRPLGSLVPKDRGRADELAVAAGVVLDEAAGRLGELFDDWEGFSYSGSDRQNRLGEETVAAAEAVLDEYRPALELAKRAGRAEEGRFRINWDAPYPGPSLPQLKHLRACARTLRFESALLARRGEAGGALENVRLIFRLRRLAQQEPTIIFRLIAFVVEHEAMTALHGILELCEPPPEELVRLQKMLSGREELNDVRWPLTTEASLGWKRFGEASSRPALLLDISADDWPSLARSDDLEGWRAVLVPVLIKLVWLEPLDRYRFLKINNRYLEWVKSKDFPEVLEWEGHELIPSGKGAQLLYPVSRSLIQVPAPSIRQEGRMNALLGQARSAIAMELFRQKYGSYAESLDRLVPEFLTELPADPYTGEPLILSRRDGRLVVYSLGEDREDNGGIPGDDRVWALPKR